MKGWTSEAVSSVSKPAGAAQAQRSASPKGKTPPAPAASITAPENDEDETPPPPLGKHHYIGPHQVTVVNGTHFPGRMRCVLVGPADEDLVRAVLGAMQSYHDAKAAKL